MTVLLKTFFDIALWRKGPQDLPASWTLAALTLIVYVCVEFFSVALLDLKLRTALVFIGVDVLMISGWLWLVLAFFERRQRFVQTITATLGVWALILALDIVIRTIHIALGLDDALVNNWLFARFLLVALIMGRIFMHALDRGLLTGMALTIAIVYSSDAVVRLTLESLARSG